eukprot:365271-Chlamydomonas_euryale.AAC.6
MPGTWDGEDRMGRLACRAHAIVAAPGTCRDVCSDWFHVVRLVPCPAGPAGSIVTKHGSPLLPPPLP